MVPNLKELFFSLVLLQTLEKHNKFASSKRRNRHGSDIESDGEARKSKTMKKTNSSKQGIKIVGRSRTKEAKASRKVNEDWQRVESTGKYRKVAVRRAGWNTTDRIAD